MLINAWPLLLIRFDGITLLGNGAPLFMGSLTTIIFPLVSSVWEKSAAPPGVPSPRSSAVGIVVRLRLPGSLLGFRSKLKKKNSFWRLVLNTLGIVIGPPRAKPSVSYRYSGFGVTGFDRLLKKLFALNISWRLYQYAVPCRFRVPRLVMTLMTAPPPWPYSAW